MMLVLIKETAEEGSRTAASLIAQAIRKNPALRLGLAAGRTPTELYRNLVNLHRSAHLDFSRFRLFSLDELIGLSTYNPNSYRAFFHQHLVDHINIDRTHLHLLNGQPKEEIASYCACYEQLIREHGGIDLQILGIGRNGHVGFNEPGSSLGSRTRAKTLEPDTVAHYAVSGKTPPNHAITMGVGTIMEARKCLMLASGADKADIICRMVEGPIMSEVPATALQMHPRAIAVLDEAAASKLKRREFYKWVFANKWRVGQK